MNVPASIARLAISTYALFISVAFAQAPTGSTGVCKDGTYTQAKSTRGACRGHGGVKEWYSEAARSNEAKTAAKSSQSVATPAATAPATAGETKPAVKASQQGMRADVAAGGGAGKVWVNTSSNVYHCIGDEWYGKTKQGEYMSEADAKTKGARPARGKACE